MWAPAKSHRVLMYAPIPRPVSRQACQRRHFDGASQIVFDIVHAQERIAAIGKSHRNVTRLISVHHLVKNALKIVNISRVDHRKYDFDGSTLVHFSEAGRIRHSRGDGPIGPNPALCLGSTWQKFIFDLQDGKVVHSVHQLGPVTELYRSFDLVFCHKGETTWPHHNVPPNSAQKRFA